MLAFNWLGNYPVYRYETYMESCGGIMDDFGSLIPLRIKGYDIILRGTYDIGY